MAPNREPRRRSPRERVLGARAARLTAIELATSADLEAGYRICEAFDDQTFSIVDRSSFVIMERLGIHRVATFDHHFAVYRFGRNRDRAFEIVN